MKAERMRRVMGRAVLQPRPTGIGIILLVSTGLIHPHRLLHVSSFILCCLRERGEERFGISAGFLAIQSEKHLRGSVVIKETKGGGSRRTARINGEQGHHYLL